MHGKRSLGLPLESPLQQSSTRNRTPPSPILEEGALSKLFGSLSLEEESTAENSSSSSSSSSSSTPSEGEQEVGEEEQANNQPMA